MSSQVYIVEFRGEGVKKLGNKDYSKEIAKDLNFEAGILPPQTYISVYKQTKENKK